MTRPAVGDVVWVDDGECVRCIVSASCAPREFDMDVDGPDAFFGVGDLPVVEYDEPYAGVRWVMRQDVTDRDPFS